MALLQRSDLQFQYSWSAIPGDDPRISGSPDNVLFSRNEGYEALYLINAFAAKHGFKQKESGLKTERLIKKHLPTNVRSQTNVVEWLEKNWKNFES